MAMQSVRVGIIGTGFGQSAQIPAFRAAEGAEVVAVCSGSKFSGYTGGTFQDNESSVCGNDVNHAVVLVGWDDGRGAWRLA